MYMTGQKLGIIKNQFLKPYFMSCFHKNLGEIFNIDNNQKCFLSSKSAY